MKRKWYDNSLNPCMSYNTIILIQVFEGNKPSNSIVFKRLTPFNLGMLIGKFDVLLFI